jgi:hypothetical protein
MKPVTPRISVPFAAGTLLTVAVLALTLAGLALGAFTQTASITLTAHSSGRSTGVRLDLSASDPAALGAKPRSVRRLLITFPAATRFNLATSLVKTCRLSDGQLKTPFGPVCPRASQIGEGTAVINAAPLTAAPVRVGVKAYDHGAEQLILVVRPVLVGASVEVIHVLVSQAKLTVMVPRVIYGKLIPGVLASLKLYVPALGAGRDALITAGRCLAGRFSVGERFTYADHAPVKLESSSRCS